MSSARPEDVEDFLPFTSVEEVLMKNDKPKEEAPRKISVNTNVTNNYAGLTFKWKDFAS